jgi:hypothetical protein
MAVQIYAGMRVALEMAVQIYAGIRVALEMAVQICDGIRVVVEMVVQIDVGIGGIEATVLIQVIACWIRGRVVQVRGCCVRAGIRGLLVRSCGVWVGCASFRVRAICL